MKPLKVRVIDDTESQFNGEKKLETEEDIREYKKVFASGGNNQANDLLSLSGLKFMSSEELLSRFIQVDNQQTIIKWTICWLLRQRFESDKLFGQYIDEFRDATGTLCPSSRKEIYRAWTAGRFCELYKINDISSIGISKTIIYELSRPVNEAIAGKVFDMIKFQKMPVYEVKRLLDKERSIDTTVLKYGSSEIDDLMGESHVEVIDYQDSIVENSPEDEDNIVDTVVALIRAHQCSAASIRVLVDTLNKMVETM